MIIGEVGVGMAVEDVLLCMINEYYVFVIKVKYHN